MLGEIKTVETIWPINHMEASLFVGLSSLEPFHSCRHALHVQCMPISWNKREFSHMKRVQSPRLVLRYQHDYYVIVLGHVYGECDIM